MSAAFHLASGRWRHSRPTRWRAMQAQAAQRAEGILSLGVGAPACVASIPMAADRPGIAGSVLRRWCRARMSPKDVLIAWDEWAVCAAGETSQPMVAVLDGLDAGESICRRAARVLADRSDCLIVASQHTADALGVEATFQAPMVPPTQVSPPAEGDDGQTIVVVLGEPRDVGVCGPLSYILGRLNLVVGRVQVRIAEGVADSESVRDMLRVLGLESVRTCTGDQANEMVRPGVLVWPACPPMASARALPIGPALHAWARGADLLLPASHPAGHVLDGCDGIVLQADTRPDAAVRAVLSRRERSNQTPPRDRGGEWHDSLSAAIASAVKLASVSADRVAQ